MTDHTIATDETAHLIASDKVEGTAVYNSAGDKLGSVHNFMVDKVSGKVEYAVMSFGGFLGIGESFHPLPWNVLKYDVNQNGYLVNLSKEMLEKGPTYKRGEEPAFNRAYSSNVYGYYGVPYGL